MKVTSTGDPQFFLKPAIRSYHFLIATILLGIDVFGAGLLLIRHLQHLSLGAAGGLVAAILFLINWWRFAARRHDDIAVLLATTQGDWTETSTRAVIASSADLIQRGLLLTSILALMLLGALAQVLGNR